MTDEGWGRCHPNVLKASMTPEKRRLSRDVNAAHERWAAMQVMRAAGSTTKEIAAHYGITACRVHQIFAKIAARAEKGNHQ